MAVVRVAEERALVRADVSGLTPQEGARIAAAVEAASVSAFHTGMAISATLVGLGGVLGLALVRTPRAASAAPTAQAASSSPRRSMRCASARRSRRRPEPHSPGMWSRRRMTGPPCCSS